MNLGPVLAISISICILLTLGINIDQLALPHTISDIESGEVCALCLNGVMGNNTLKRYCHNKCNSWFHHECWIACMNYQTRCPVCRSHQPNMWSPKKSNESSRIPMRRANDDIRPNRPVHLLIHRYSEYFRQQEITAKTTAVVLIMSLSVMILFYAFIHYFFIAHLG